MRWIEALIEHVTPRALHARPRDLRIGGHWTVAALEVAGALRGGLASTLADGDDAHHGGRVPVRDAGHLLDGAVADWVALARSSSLWEASVGLATINALLEVPRERCVAVNAAEVIAERGAGRNVAIVGHFPFVPRIRERAGRLWVLELNPRAGDLPASQADEILPQADVIAVTGTTLLNHTFAGLARLWRPEAFVVMLGGTTPLSPLLFEAGVDALAGTLVEDVDSALLSASQGATFRQMRGKRLVTLFREGGDYAAS